MKASKYRAGEDILNLGTELRMIVKKKYIRGGGNEI